MNYDYDNISNTEIKNVINEYIHSERDRIILTLNLIDNYTYQQISDYLYSLDMENRTKGMFTNYSLSAKQIGRVIAKKEQIIFKHLKGDKNNG